MTTTTSTYDVKGMTCGHCASSVSTELNKLPGVNDVAVDLGAGKVTVSSDQPLDTDTVRSAVDEAGFELVI